MISSQEITDIFSILLEGVISRKPYETKRQNIYKKLGFDTSIGTLILLSLCTCSFLVAYISQFINSSILPSKAILLMLFISYFLIFLSLQIPMVYGKVKNTQERTVANFVKNKYQAEVRDWRIANELAEKSNFNKGVLEIVKIKIQHSVENIENIAKIKRIAKSIYSVLIVLIIVYAWIPNNVLWNSLNSDNLKISSGILALLSVLVAGINLVGELFLESSFQTEISKLKKCLYLIEQAKLLIDSRGKND